MGFVFWRSELAIWFYRAHSKNFSVRSRRKMECYTPATLLQHVSCTAEWCGWVFNFNPSLPHYALLMRKDFPSFAPTFILSRYHTALPPSYDLLAPPKPPVEAAGPLLHPSMYIDRWIEWYYCDAAQLCELRYLWTARRTFKGIERRPCYDKF